MTRRAWLLTLLATMTLWADRSRAGNSRLPPQGIAVIVHWRHPAKLLKPEDLRPIFLTNKTDWTHGGAIEALNLPDGSDVRAAFDSAVLGMDPDEVARYWVDRRIRGDARPPRKVSSPALVVAFVSKNEGAIGYVPYSAIDDGVKVVARVFEGHVLAP
jgi:ABC-type phosphate transport system substrate-binding protein